MQENALGRFGGHTMGAPMPLPQHLIQFGVDRPRISFSEVLSFDLNHEAIHFIHQPGGSDGPRPFSHGQPAVLRRRFSRQRLPACSEAAMREYGCQHESGPTTVRHSRLRSLSGCRRGEALTLHVRAQIVRDVRSMSHDLAKPANSLRGPVAVL